MSGIKIFGLRPYFYFLTLIGMTLPMATHAASFDCTKAHSKMERLICDNPTISKLDDKLGKAYQDVINKANDEEKQRLTANQNHWIKYTRNICLKETCFKHAYWSRLAELGTFFIPHSLLYKKESDKAEAIKQVLTTAPLYESQPERPFCGQMFEDLKQMKGIRFVDPTVQVQSYEDPALDPWKQQCKGGVPLHFSYRCLPNIWPGNKENLSAECSAGYGLPPFKLFELPSYQNSEKTRYIFYSDESYGPMNQDWLKPSLGGGFSFSGFHQIDFSQCDKLVERAFLQVTGGVRSGPNFNSVIEYDRHYYLLALHHRSTPSYWLEIQPVGHIESCRWTPVKPK